MIKKIAITLAAIFIIISAVHAQVQDPVKWSYVAVKKSDKEYTVNILARLDATWHIYSMNTPNGGPVATTFSFKRNPLVIIEILSKSTKDYDRGTKFNLYRHINR